MGKLVTICAVVALILVPACVSQASIVTPPTGKPNAPAWWNSDTGDYAYGYWSTDIGVGGSGSPDEYASNYLPSSSNFTASVGATNSKLTITLGNRYDPALLKQIYLYAEGTMTSTGVPVSFTMDATAPVPVLWDGNQASYIGIDGWNVWWAGTWTPQPNTLTATITVPGMINVTSIWAGEQCVPVPVPGAVLLGFLGLSAAGIKLRRFA